MPIAYNAQTGEAMSLQNGQWSKTQVAKNAQTGETLALDGGAWKPVGGGNGAQATATQEKGTGAQTPVPEKSFGQKFVEGAKRGFEQTGVGALQLASQAGAMKLPEGGSDYLATRANELEQQGKGTGLAGTLGEIVGSPTTYLPIPAAKGAAAGLGALAKTAAKMGAIGGLASGAIAPSTDKDQSLAQRALSTGVSGAAGAVMAPAAALGGAGAARLGTKLTGAVMPGLQRVQTEAGKVLGDLGIDASKFKTPEEFRTALSEGFTKGFQNIQQAFGRVTPQIPDEFNLGNVAPAAVRGYQKAHSALIKAWDAAKNDEIPVVADDLAMTLAEQQKAPTGHVIPQKVINELTASEKPAQGEISAAKEAMDTARQALDAFKAEQRNPDAKVRELDARIVAAEQKLRPLQGGQVSEAEQAAAKLELADANLQKLRYTQDKNATETKLKAAYDEAAAKHADVLNRTQTATGENTLGSLIRAKQALQFPKDPKDQAGREAYFAARDMLDSRINAYASQHPEAKAAIDAAMEMQNKFSATYQPKVADIPHETDYRALGAEINKLAKYPSIPATADAQAIVTGMLKQLDNPATVGQFAKGLPPAGRMLMFSAKLKQVEQQIGDNPAAFKDAKPLLEAMLKTLRGDTSRARAGLAQIEKMAKVSDKLEQYSVNLGKQGHRYKTGFDMNRFENAGANVMAGQPAYALKNIAAGLPGEEMTSPLKNLDLLRKAAQPTYNYSPYFAIPGVAAASGIGQADPFGRFMRGGQ